MKTLPFSLQISHFLVCRRNISFLVFPYYFLLSSKLSSVLIITDLINKDYFGLVALLEDSHNKLMLSFHLLTATAAHEVVLTVQKMKQVLQGNTTGSMGILQLVWGNYRYYGSRLYHCNNISFIQGIEATRKVRTSLWWKVQEACHWEEETSTSRF